jgi:hypothetical protein
MPATHGFATDNFGGPCEFTDLEYFIKNCYVGKNSNFVLVLSFEIVRLIWLMMC